MVRAGTLKAIVKQWSEFRHYDERELCLEMNCLQNILVGIQAGNRSVSGRKKGRVQKYV